jgi:hypothetical protein
MLLKLLRIVPSHKQEKKYTAVFEKDGREKTISFGAVGYPDFTKPPHDENKKNLYLKRHSKREDWNNPLTAGSLSKHILWNKSSLKESIKDFKKKFGV